jgi:hypothetical protein
MQQAPHVSKIDNGKPYQKPNMKIYGHVEALTTTVGNIATMDGGSGAMSKTH